MNKKRIFFILFILYLAGLGFACFGHFESIPEPQKLIFGLPIDKVVHFSMFLPFPLLTLAAFRSRTTKVWQSLLLTLAVFIVGCILAGATELIQGLTDYRSCDPLDFRADSIGLALGSLAAFCIDLRKGFKRL